MQTTDTLVLHPRNRGSLVQPMQLIEASAGCPPLKVPQQTENLRMRAPTENQVNAKAPAVSTCPYAQYHPKRSSKVRKIDKVYVGLLLELPPPVEVQVKWNIDVRGYLEEDLCQATRQLPQHLADNDVVIELDLCMAGKKLARSDRAQLMQTECIKDPLRLTPMVWIRCGSKKCKKKVDDTITKLSYLHQFIRHFNLDPPHSSLHAPWPAASEIASETSLLDDDRQISFDIERSEDRNTICGTKVRFTVNIGHVSTTICSTIGGMVKVDDRLYALTTAHGIVNHVLSLERRSRTKDPGDAKEEEEEEDSEGSSDCESDDSSSSGSETAQPYSMPAAKSATKDAWDSSQDNVDWTRLPLPKILKYLHHGTTVGDYSLPNTSTTPSQADFVLIDIEAAGLPKAPNAMIQRGVLSAIDDHIPASDLADGMVDIIADRHGRHVSGYLLRGDTSIILRGTIIRTKKIQVDYANAAGISGAWVVRRNKLCGIIYAAYDKSPYLHMLTAETVFQEIGAWMHASEPVIVARKRDYSLAPQGSVSTSKSGSTTGPKTTPSLNKDSLSYSKRFLELIASGREIYDPDYLALSAEIHSNVVPRAQPSQAPESLSEKPYPQSYPTLGRQRRVSALRHNSAKLPAAQRQPRSSPLSSIKPLDEVARPLSTHSMKSSVPEDRFETPDISFGHEDPKLIFDWAESDGYDHSTTGKFSSRCPMCFKRYMPPLDSDFPINRMPYYERRKEDLEELKQRHYEQWAQEHTRCPAPSAEDINKRKRALEKEEAARDARRRDASRLPPSYWEREHNEVLLKQAAVENARARNRATSTGSPVSKSDDSHRLSGKHESIPLDKEAEGSSQKRRLQHFDASDPEDSRIPSDKHKLEPQDEEAAGRSSRQGTHHFDISESDKSDITSSSFLPESRILVRRDDQYRSERDIKEEIRQLEDERRMLKYERETDYEIIERRDPSKEKQHVDTDDFWTTFENEAVLRTT